MKPVQVTAAIYSTQVSQASSPAERSPLGPGDRGPEVKNLQETLKKLGHYEGVADGVYESTTITAVSQFQESVGLSADGVVGVTTWERLLSARDGEEQEPPTTPQPAQSTSKLPGFLKGKMGWALLGLGAFALVAVVGFLVQLLMRSSDSQEDLEGNGPSQRAAIAESDSPKSASQQNYDGNGYSDAPPGALAELGEPPRLAKLDIVEELIADLHRADPAKRRRAIWELGQRGDSRAVQPLVNLMVDSDSKQRSLILAALSEIGTRTLTPMNRALGVSLQDENAEVRKNAIRDLTRIYELVAQMSQMLRHAVDDPDPEVQETARWALGQLSQIRLPPGIDSRHALPNLGHPPEEEAGQ